METEHAAYNCKPIYCLYLVSLFKLIKFIYFIIDWKFSAERGLQFGKVGRQRDSNKSDFRDIPSRRAETVAGGDRPATRHRCKQRRYAHRECAKDNRILFKQVHPKRRSAHQQWQDVNKTVPCLFRRWHESNRRVQFLRRRQTSQFYHRLFQCLSTAHLEHRAAKEQWDHRLQIDVQLWPEFYDAYDQWCQIGKDRRYQSALQAYRFQHHSCLDQDDQAEVRLPSQCSAVVCHQHLVWKDYL